MSKIKKIVPNSRLDYKSVGLDTLLTIGMPIGLLLALTYAVNSTHKGKGGKAPSSRIGNIIKP